MKLIRNRKWSIESEETALQIKEWLLNNGGKENTNKTNSYERWRIKYSDATISYYVSGKKKTIYITDSNDTALIEVHKFINSLLGSKFKLSNKRFLAGFDEVGKGEVLGHLILAGVIFPIEIFSDLDSAIGIADTKIRHEVQYWEDIFKRIDFYKTKGLDFVIEKIPPWEIDKYNINKLLDLTYQRILLSFAQKYDLKESRIVFDDYNIGPSLTRYLNFLEKNSAEIICTTDGDEEYLEVRVASLIAKYMQQKVFDALSKTPEFQISGQILGSGNASDEITIGWLRAWYQIHKDWPWFVKKSFKTIQEIEGKSKSHKKLLPPPINDRLLSKEFIEKFESGELNFSSLSIVCPFCGSISKSIKLIPKEGKTTAICINCGKEINDLAITLRYYCGRILPDTNVILRGFLSKDLSGEKFFENYTILLHPLVKKQSDNKGGKKELERLGKFASIGRIKLEEISTLFDLNKGEGILIDEAIQIGAMENNAILITADNAMKGSAQSKGLFVFEL